MRLKIGVDYRDIPRTLARWGAEIRKPNFVVDQEMPSYFDLLFSGYFKEQLKADVLLATNSSTSLISTNSTTPLVMAGSEITISSLVAGTILYLCSMNTSQSDVGQATRVEIFKNNALASASRAFDCVGYLASTTGVVVPVTPAMAVAVSPGTNTVDVRWYSGNASYTHYSKVRYAFGLFLPS